MTENELELMDRYLNGTASPEEKAAIESWFNLRSSQVKPSIEMTEDDTRRDRLWNSIGVQHKRKLQIMPFLRYTAAAVVALTALTWFYLNDINTPNTKQVTANEIKPGGNKAILTLANGTEVSLNAHNGKIAINPGLGVLISNNSSNGVITFKNDSKTEGVDIHTNSDGPYAISTPNGGQYQLVLPDGTGVFLNASSRIIFPSRFAGKTRTVTLIGEAYFEVTKDPDHPFQVNTKEQQLTVLGTHFNVAAYPGETVKTTLAEGSVSLLQPSTGIKQPLKPNQQAALLSTGFDVKTVLASEEIAWKDGMFIFNTTPLKEAMRQISRWYNVEVEYDSMPDTPLRANLSRSLTLGEVLDGIAFAGNFQFKLIDGRRLKFIKK